jgi:hypothetical protein
MNKVELALSKVQRDKDTCCCKVGSTVKDMRTYEALKGSLFKPMNFYADKNKSSDKIGGISEGSKFWALNANPEEDGWIEIAYVKNGNVGTGWSRLADYRYKFVETEQVKHTECRSSAETCDPDDITVPGATDNVACETFLNNVPILASQEAEWRKDAPTLLGEARDLFKERSSHLTTTLPEQVEFHLQKLESLLEELKEADYCVSFPPWCAFRHWKLRDHWNDVRAVVKKMVGIFAGHEEMSDDLHAHLAAMRDHEALATKIRAMEKALVRAELKALDGSGTMRAFAWATAAASKTQYKAFCSGKPFYDEVDSWKNPKWWKDMFADCPKDALTPKEISDLQAITDVPVVRNDVQANSVIRQVVASGRGVSLLQMQEKEEDSSSSFVERTEGVQERRDAAEAILTYLFLVAVGCSTSTAMFGAMMAL